MKAVAVLGLALCATSGTAFSATVKAPPVGCASFMKEFPAAANSYRVSFERPLTISRGFDEALSGVEVRILSTNTDVDGTLKCRGDQFLRFELRIGAPAKDRIQSDFDSFQQAGLMAAFHWDRGKAQTVVKAMASDAAEYLRASRERGDVYLAGKVEYHQGDALDLGVIWTETDHAFVVTSQTDE